MAYITRLSDRSWFTAEGSKIQAAKLSKRFKSLETSNETLFFLTLTVDPAAYPHPAIAYRIGTSRMRFLMYNLRKLYGNFKYFWKLEFHESGYPHWHVILRFPGRNRQICEKSEFSTLIERIAFYFRLPAENGVHIRKLSGKNAASAFRYLCKYTVKGVKLPNWVLSFKRIRVVQSSVGFYSTHGKAEKPPADFPSSRICKKEPARRSNTTTIGERYYLSYSKFCMHDFPNLKDSRYKKFFNLSTYGISYEQFLSIFAAGLLTIRTACTNLIKERLPLWKKINKSPDLEQSMNVLQTLMNRVYHCGACV